MRIGPALAVLAAAMVVLAGPAAASTTRVVHKSDSGTTITVHKGDRLVVRLRECAPCGYAWKTAKKPDASVLKRIKSVYVARTAPRGGPPVVGGAGTRVITYRARGTGRTSLRLAYRSPSGMTGDTFSLRVRVKR